MRVRNEVNVCSGRGEAFGRAVIQSRSQISCLQNRLKAAGPLVLHQPPVGPHLHGVRDKLSSLGAQILVRSKMEIMFKTVYLKDR